MSSIAIYPGSFDPLTNGHVDIIQRGARLFDRIIVAMLINMDKSPLFTMPERVEIAREVFHGSANVEVDTFDGLLVDYARRRNAGGDRPRAAGRLRFRVRDADGADEPPPQSGCRDRVHDAGRAVHLRQLAAGQRSRRARRVGHRPGAAHRRAAAAREEARARNLEELDDARVPCRTDCAVTDDEGRGGGDEAQGGRRRRGRFRRR